MDLHPYLPAELYTREVCTTDKWRESELGGRIVKQLCRELLLLESSDWQFLITTGAARDYAELRFETHNDQFNELKAMWQAFEAAGEISPEQQTRLAAIEERDSVFADIDPSFWASGARQMRIEDHGASGAAASSTGSGEPVQDATPSEVLKFVSTNRS